MRIFDPLCGEKSAKSVYHPALASAVAVPGVRRLSVVPLSGAAAASKPSLSNWTKAKHGKVLVPAKAPAKPAAKAPPPAPAPRTATASVASKSKAKPDPPAVAKTKPDAPAAAKAKSDGAPVSGRSRCSGSRGRRPARPAGRRQHAAHARAAGHDVAASGRQRRAISRDGRRRCGSPRTSTARSAAAAPAGQATVQVRSGVSGRRIASVRFSGERGALATDVGDRVVAADGSAARAALRRGRQAAQGRAARDAHRRGHAARDAAPPTTDLPPHLRNEPPKGRQKDDPWAEE